jgi:putative oxidoreductase
MAMATTAYYHNVEIVEPDRNAVSTALLATRLAAGLIMLPHGAQHLFGAFAGPGLNGTVQFLGPIGYLVAIGEFFGAIALLAGVLSRFSAAAIIIIMIGAVLKVHLPNGFFMNWAGTQKGEGFEYHLLMIGNLLPTLIAGPGAFALSRSVPVPSPLE